jgi:hypothetical protein
MYVRWVSDGVSLVVKRNSLFHRTVDPTCPVVEGKERLLKQDIGYRDYASRVPYRVLPMIF